LKIIVTGACGQLGSCIATHLSSSHDVLALGHPDLDITDECAVRTRIVNDRPDAVINCAAYNDVDAAEAAPLDALRLNGIAVSVLGRAVRSVGAVLVHFSSDYVFDGSASTPYTEESRPHPRSVYGISKLAGEWLARDAERFYVLRVASLFGGNRSGRSALESIVQALLNGQDVRALSDRTVSATYVEDVARAVESMLTRSVPAGLYHCVNAGMATWVEIAYEVARLLRLEPRVVATTTHSVEGQAPRPRFTPMSTQKLASFGIDMPSWQNALARYLARSSRVSAEPVEAV
jgi:dTDP-4-dehydrorhamnose reductase